MQKSNEHQIDQLFGDAFRDADADFDKDSMWTDLQSSLPNRNDRFLFWISLGTGVLLCIYFALLLGGTTGLNTNNMATLSQESVPAVSENPDNNSPQKKMATPATSEATNDQAKSTASAADSENRSSAFGSPAAQNQSEKAESAENTLDQNDSPQNPNTSTSFNRTNAPGKATDKPGKATIQSPNNTPSGLKGSGSDLLASSELNRLALLPLVPIDRETKLTYKDPKWSQCDVKGRPPKFFAESYVFGAYPLIENSLNPNPENQSTQFLNDWNESESPVGSYAFGLMLGMGTNWGGSISAGLEFQQVVNKINREQTVIERITVYDEMAYFYLDSNNNKVWVADSVTSTRIYNREIQMEKTHTLVNVPVTLGYHIERGQWRFGLTAGVNLHIYKKFNGKVLDPSGQIIDASTGSNLEVYDTDMSFSITGGLDLGYLMNDHLELYVSPRFRYHSDSWLDESHPLESHIQLVGLRGGARYHF